MQNWPRLKKGLMLAGLLTALQAQTVSAQVSAGGSPMSFQRSFDARVSTFDLPVPDVNFFLAEDAAEQDLPYRFGAPIPVDLDLDNSGSWTDTPKGRVWRLRLLAPGAHSLNIQYDSFNLPVGAELFVYNDDQSMVLGAFTEFNNSEHGGFATQPVAGDALILEYFEPNTASFHGEISLESVVYGYRNLFGMANDDRGFNDSGSCNNNVNCPEGTDWEGQSRSVAMILTSGGSRICTGAMINNTAQDQTQYFLTADHCGLTTGSYIFMFNYESPSCSNVDGPTTDSVQGCTLKAEYSASDFTLVELTETIPSSYGVYYAGWSNIDTPSTESVGIHHPSGDIKKISFDYDASSSDSYLGNSGDDGSHWKVTQWDDGTTEPGSSGSPLFDQNHRIIGQLHGGYASCSSLTADWYGKVSMSWTNGLSAWLDPLNSGASVLDGLDSQAPPTDPNLAMQSVSVQDGVDNDLDPGDTAGLIINILNTGADATSITGQLSESSAYVSVTDNSGSWANLNQGQSGDNSANPFSITVDPGTPIGHTVNFTLQLAAAGGYSNTLQFSLPVGLVIEGFESGNFNAYDWTQGGTAPWSVVNSPVYEGANSAKAGTVTHNETSEMHLDLNVTEAGTIAFAYKVSSEPSYDFLRFSIDGAEQDAWAGVIDWTEVSYAVTAGPHTFSWIYDKDGSVDSNDDTAWVDRIVLPPMGTPSQPDIDVSPLSFSVTLPEGSMDTDLLNIGNTGDADLNWSLGFSDTTPLGRSVEGSTLTSDITTFTPGDALTLTLSLYNASTDVEWIEGADMSFPAGINVTGASDFTGGTGGDLVYDGVTGDGAFITWFGEDGSGWGVIRGDETGVATLSMSIDASYMGDISIPYTIQGDVYGDEPHSVSAVLVLTNDGPVEPPFLTWDAGNGSTAPAGNSTVTLTFDATDKTPGVYTGEISISSNDPDESPLTIPVTMTVVPAVLDPVLDLSIATSGNHVVLDWSDMPGATQYLIYEKNADGSWSPIGSSGVSTYQVSNVVGNTEVRQYRVTVDY